MIHRRNLLLTSLSAIAVAGLTAACRAPLQVDAPDSEFFLRENSPPEEIVPKLMVYARKGEVTTCENGHPLATLTQDAMVMGRPHVGHWKFIGESRMGMTECPTCSGRVMGGLGIYYFDGALRTINHSVADLTIPA